MLIKRVAKVPVLGGQRRRGVHRGGRLPGRGPSRRRGVAHPGSGKSLEMVFYAAKVMRDPRMTNPTLVFITDRNDLDDQLFGEVFAPATILPEKPEQADNRAELRTLLRRNSGGIIFTTLQKFRPGEDNDRNPVLTDRRNVVVVADEAHRSQYGFGESLDSEGRLKAGLAQHLRDALPGATFLGFTGTPSSPPTSPRARSSVTTSTFTT